MESDKENNDLEVSYLLKVYGESILKNMMEEWKNDYIEDTIEKHIKKKIKEQYNYLMNLRKENEQEKKP